MNWGKKTVKDLPKEFQHGFKYTYKDIRKCVFKKESDDDSETCRKLWKDLGVDEV